MSDVDNNVIALMVLQEENKQLKIKLDKIEQIVARWNNDASHSFSDMCKINEILKQELNTFKLEMELKF